MTLPVPINRTELYLAKIAGEDVTIPTEPINNTEVFLARLAGADIVLPTPINTLQVWLAILCGELYTMPPVQGAELIGVQMVRTEFLAASAGLDGVTTPTPENRAEEYWAKIAEEMAVQTITVKGTSLHLLHVVSGIEDLQYVYGDTEQTKYSGKNLLELANYTAGNVVTTLNSDGTITTVSSSLQYNYANFMTYQKAISLPAGTYSFSRSGDTTYRASIDIWDSGKTNHKTISLNAGSSSESFSTSWDIAYIAGAYTSLTVGSALNTTSGFQIEKGSATAFEPYVGGTASPNPDYPQDVHVVTGSQVVNVHGKNILQVTNDNITQNNSSVGKVTVTHDDNNITLTTTADVSAACFVYYYTQALDSTKTYTLSTIIKKISGTTTNRIGFSYSDDGTTWASNTLQDFNIPAGSSAGYSKTFTGHSYYRFGFYACTGTGTTTGDKSQYADLQLEQGSASTTYQQFNNTDYSLTLGSLELCKIGDYQDYIYKSGDDWYVHKEIGKQVLGDLTWISGGTNQTGIYRKATEGVKTTILPSANNEVFNGLCTHFGVVRSDSAGTYGANTGISVGPTGTIFVYYSVYNASGSTDNTNFRTWLSDNNVTLYYALATATDTKITDATLVSQLNALDSAILPTPEAFVTVSGNLPAPIQFTYQGKL